MLRTRAITLCLLLLALVATPALAYTIYLKDGSRLLAKTKYVIEGDRAIIVLPSGQKTSFPAAEIDVERTEAANQQNLGTAIVIEGGKAQDLARNQAPPPKESLQDLIQKRGAEVAEPPPPVQSRAPVGAEVRRRPDPAGRTPFRNPALANELKAFLITRGVAAEVYQGSTAQRARLVFETRSEGAAFKALLATAAAFVDVRERFPGQLEALQLQLDVPDSTGSAGRFTMTPEQAAALVGGRIELTRYYVDNVEF